MKGFYDYFSCLFDFIFFCLECSRDVTSLLVDTGNGANLSFIIFVLLNSSQHLGVTLNVLTIKHKKEFYIYAVVHFVSLQNIVMYKCNTKVMR